MQLEQVYVPFGAYWSTPFCKWQGSFSTQHPIPFVAECATRALAERDIAVESLDGMCLGMTVPFCSSFYGGPWLAGLMGMKGVTGPIISQACATSVRCVAYGAQEIVTRGASVFLAITADRTSNGPHLYYPNPAGPGGTGVKEDWVLDNFGKDPFAKNPMIQTAENVAKEAGIEREAQDAVALLRFEQYQKALADDRAFQKRYMLSPIEVKGVRARKVIATVVTDEGPFHSTAEGLARLRPVLPGGTVTFGSQTFPADGNAGMVICGQDQARRMSSDQSVEVQLLSYSQTRVKKGYMPMANLPALRLALSRAGIELRQIKAITTHTPFGVNDVYLSRELEIAPEEFNRYGCSLVWGHPQAPTGLRSIIELIEELALTGGGYGLFTGCAAGDTAAALVLKVTVS